MKFKGLFFLTVLAGVILTSCGSGSIKSAKLKTKEDSLSYAFGVVYYNALSGDSLMIDPVLLAKGMVDTREGKTLFSDDAARGYIQAFVNEREEAQYKREEEQNKVLYKDYIAENEAFLTKNSERNGVTVTPSGLQYEVIKMGTGPKPTINSTVRVHYVGTFIDGTEFDSSYKRNEPAEFALSGVIPGWTEALQLMPVGSKFKIYLPESL
ncbi:MAG: FKBP-type peptidyl-prolyl cis-trans isomerase, partial [Bacteroidales bacterium]|nr:FKBP-type peptidyl-prolyl cis-trans isomerase [Bacteroidales bacterium]